MKNYVVQRIVALFLTLFIIMAIAFLVIRLMPGSIYDSNPDLTPEMRAALDAKYHFDKPIPIQFVIFLEKMIVEGDWGTSIKMQPNVPVFDIVKSRVPVSLYINIFSLLLSLPIGIAAGIVAAIKKNTLTDHTVSFIVVIFISVPSFVFATILQYFLAFKLGSFPIIYNASAQGIAKFYSLFLPILALSFGPIARVTRYLRAELAETLNAEFMLLARTKGLTHGQATIRHGIRNSMIPLANIIIPMFTSIMGGSLVVESIFSVPGMGGLMIESINSNDHPLTLAVLIFYSFISLITILIVDLSYGVIDPRIRIGGKG